MPSIVTLAVSPIRYYQERVAGPAQWVSPAAAVACYGALVALAQFVALARMVGEWRTDVGVLLSTITAVFVVFFFALQAGTVIFLEWLFSSARSGWRLLECSALAYWTQVPFAAISIGFWTVMEPGPPVLPARAGIGVTMEVLDGVTEQLPAAVHVLQDLAAYYSLWVVALQAAALRAVSEFTVGGAATAGCLLGLVFVVLPWLFQRF